MKPLVDVNIAVYNHAPYLIQTLNSVLCQKTNFDFRLLIGDDCSTDGSIEILKDYEKKYSSQVKVIYQKKNLGFKSNITNGLIIFKSSTAKYIALLDGDDYWTDPFKLQKQVDFLEANEHASGCFHHASFVNEKGEVIQEIYNNSIVSNFEFYNQEQCLTVLGSSYATSSLVFRREVLENVPEILMSHMCDEFLDLIITENGLLYFLNFNGACYRFHNGGIWSGTSAIKSIINLYKRTKVLYKIPAFKKRYATYLKFRIFSLAQQFLFSSSIKRKVRISYFLRTLQYLDYHKKETYDFISRFFANVTGLQKLWSKRSFLIFKRTSYWKK